MKPIQGRKPSASLLVATVALVLAASGTAVAVAQQVNGDKLIAKNSLSGNRLRSHSLSGKQVNLNKLGKVPSAALADHATSALHATSATTAISATNANHATSATAAISANHAASAITAITATSAASATNATHAITADSAPLAQTLSSGKSLMGAYGLIGHATGPFERAGAAISFEIPLETAPIAHFVAKGTIHPAACPGTAAAPKAVPGNLCIYESVNTNVFGTGFEDPLTANTGSAVDRFGAEVVALSSAAGNYDDSGSWAVTAP